ncbi:hypothetical protein M0813_16056 [Anaeramoeba flamelloides]|uniref:Rap-GAP domain-containing protein n=1 Tax=Anaeramoeba flamelloides TaxID=1746091 RepID=A0ABQ8Z123_9EUKA|nr:hypothetical protein M0813_16056 [Anaeramoeba flamelloides]
MFLERIPEVTSLVANPETGVLVKFPHSVKRNIISAVLDVLLDNNSPPDLCSSSFSIKWVMECSGQSFALPLSENRIIKKGITLYKDWLNGINLPPKFLQDKNEYYRTIFGHFSLLFNPRNDWSNGFDKIHVDLCLQIIDIFANTATKKDGWIDNDSWLYMLSVLIGITDNLLAGKGSHTEPRLTDELTPHLLKLLFDLWLKSKTRNLGMWKQLKHVFINWRHRKETIIQWSSTSYGLLNSLINLFYGECFGSQDVIVQIPTSSNIQLSPSKIQLKEDLLIFVWNQILHLIENPNDLLDPKLFLISMKGIQQLVTLFLTFQQEIKNSNSNEIKYIPDSPSGNTILNIFGNWLFEAVSDRHKNYDQGIECAYSTLCQIFMSPQIEPFLFKYLTRFYQALIYAFTNPRTRGICISAIFCHTTQIFTSNLVGVHSLLPYYLHYLHQFLVKNEYFEGSIFSNEILRRSCAKILITILPFPRYFEDLTIEQFPDFNINTNSSTNTNINTNEQQQQINVKKITTYNEILQILPELLIKGFNTETDAANGSLFIWGMNLYIHETIEIKPEDTISIIKNLQNFLNSPKTNHAKWPIEVLLSALNSLEIISEFTEQISKHSNNIIQQLIITLSELVIRILIKKFNLTEPLTKNDEILMCKLFQVIGNFILATEWIYDCPKVLVSVLQSIEFTISPEKIQEHSNNKKKRAIRILNISNTLREVASLLLHKILLQLGDFPSSMGPSSVSSHTDEKEICKQYGLTEKEFESRVRYFSINGERIVSIFEESSLNLKSKQENKQNENINTDNDEKTLTIIIRDTCGKFAWRARFRSLPLNYPIVPKSQLARHKWKGEPRPPIYKKKQEIPQEITHEKIIDYQLNPQEFDYLSSEMELQLNSLTRVVLFQHRLEEVYRYVEEECTFVPTKCQIPRGGGSSYLETTNVKTGKEDPNLTKNENNQNETKYEKIPALGHLRMFLSNFGLLKLQGKGDIEILENNKELQKLIENLDTLNERSVSNIGVIYIACGQNRETNQNIIWKNQKGSEEYEQFLTELGWVIDLQEHKNINNEFYQKNSIKHSRYYANQECEMLFHVLTDLHFNENDRGKKVSLFSSHRVTIVWIDDNRNWDPNSIKLGKNDIFIIIRPNISGLYSIEVVSWKPNKNMLIGPLLNSCLVSRHILAGLVRKTARIADKEMNNPDCIYVEPLKLRLQNIRSICSILKEFTDTTEFYSKLFQIPNIQKK